MAFARTFFRDDQIAGRDPDSEQIAGGYWMGLQYEHSSWSWVDHWPLTVSNWAPGHPNQDTWNKKHDCGRMTNNGQFYNDDCKRHLPYVCKAEFIDSTPSWADLYDQLGRPINCTDEWAILGIHCYKGYRYLST